MDLATLFLICLMSLVIGAVLMLIIQYYVFIKYCDLPEESLEQRAMNEKYALPENIISSIKSNDPENKNAITALNLIIQFLFHELKNSTRIRNWIYKKLSLELDELVANTTTGKLFDKLVVRDLYLGTQFPEVKCLRVHNADLHEEENHMESLDLILELKYKGNFRLSIDADMVLGKKGSLTLKVKHVEGLARLQFTRTPCTHWSLSFLGDPKLELDIESHFQGRQLQSNVINLIISQIKKAVRRKHTLPNYRLRYLPFFYNTSPDDDFDNEIVPNGKLTVKIMELTRLNKPREIRDVYCILTLASISWVEVRQNDDRTVIASLDIVIHKAKTQQIGIVFKQDENCVQVAAVLPNTPALKAKLKTNDILISIEGKYVTTIAQVAKIMKSLHKSVFKLRIERIIAGSIRNDAILPDLEPYEDFQEMNISFTKSSELIQMISRKSSIDTSTVSPSSSPRKPQILNKVTFKNTTKDNNETTPIEENLQTPIKAEPKDDMEYYQQHSTIDCEMNSFIRMDDLSTFMLDERSNYLNICVYGKSETENCLLGYENVSINSLLTECSYSNLNQHLKTYSLKPPVAPDLKGNPLKSHSGFNPKLCFGDILISFDWQGNRIPVVETPLKKPKLNKASTEDIENFVKTHNFNRKQFTRSTLCDYCGKKIWLKDGVQCNDCSMSCHKKCIAKSQSSTVCGSSDGNQPELILTEAQIGYDLIEDTEYSKPKIDCQTIGEMLAQGLKRVNSANNLAIPGIGSPLNQNSRSLPPSPHHTPRKQSLVNQSTNPFTSITQRLEKIPNDVTELTTDQMLDLVEPILSYPKPSELMNLSKTTSKNLYPDLAQDERVEKINKLLSKIRLALDSETSNHATLSQSLQEEAMINISNRPFIASGISGTSNVSSTSNVSKTSNASRSSNVSKSSNVSNTSTISVCQIAKIKAENIFRTPSNTLPIDYEAVRQAILVKESEEKIEALSVIMFYLCSGLQHAQGVALT